MNNKALLTIIAVIALGILVVLVVQMNKETPGEKIANSVSETVEEIGDEIDDNTDAR